MFPLEDPPERVPVAAVLVLVLVCCCGAGQHVTDAVTDRFWGSAPRPDVHSAAVTAARATAERRIAQSVAVAAPPGATKVGQSWQALCSPGSHGLKVHDDFDNICLSRRTSYLRVPAATLTAVLTALHQQLLGAGWSVPRGDVGERRSLTDPDVLVSPTTPGGVPNSLFDAEYERGDDHLEFKYGGADGAFLAELTSWQQIRDRLGNAYFNDSHLLTEAALRAAVTRAGAPSAVIAVAAQRVWFQNG